MKKNDEFARVAHILNEKQSICICLPQNPHLDAVATATALYLTLLHMGKQVSLAAPDEINPQFGLAGQDKIQSQLSSDGSTLVVSFPYTEGSVDKVTYNIEGDRFNLLIQPKDGVGKLNAQKVAFNYTGGKADVIITVYTPTLNSLGNLYNSQKDKFSGVEIINIDRHFTNNNYGTVNIVDKKAASTSEIVVTLLRSLNAKIDKDAATNLYAGIVAATNNFTAHAVSAQTFEASAFLLNNGAIKKPISMPTGAGFGQTAPAMPPMGNSVSATGFNQSFNQPFNVGPSAMTPSMQPPQAQPQMQPQLQPQSFGQQQPMPVSQAQPQSQSQSQDEFPENPEELDEQIQPGTSENKEVSSQSWLKPKIFKGSNLI